MVRKSSICCIGFVILILIIAVVLRAVNGIDQYKFDDADLNHQLSYDVNRIIKEVSEKMTQNNKL